MIERDIVFAKIGIIQRCLRRIKQTTAFDPASLDNLDKQDIFALNLQRAVQAALDLAAHVVASEGLGVPQELKELFTFLEQSGIIPAGLADQMKKMVGFRNIAVHEYQELDVSVLKSILTKNLKNLEDFYTAVIRYYDMADG